MCVSVVKCRRSLTGEHPCTLVGGLSPNIGVGGQKNEKLGSLSFVGANAKFILFFLMFDVRQTDV